ncbi:hypothetical protein [Paraburkholderia dinghuensis]|uniref:Uncharacterized protein n=1 Tax=Paraburkholderia dinghuensis TaxID=2305225 RepID=A0A3N6N189_9BURK|nr:hypothetical protein [Paraburkholderia dinghuensis]RQH04251.1 hypothetical protein D1Y85_19390 [Paraburkholderia dinghuensis]
MKRTYILLLLIGLAAGHASATEALFENHTEDSTNGWAHVTPAFAKALMKHEAQQQDLSGYAESGDIPKDPGTRLVQKAVPIGLHGKKVLYVRPTLEPYFAPFYGAHQFQHWLVSNGRIFYEGSSDVFRVLPSDHDGMRDIEETACTAVKCYSTQFKFDSKSGCYKAASCHATSVSNDKETEPCDLVGK